MFMQTHIMVYNVSLKEFVVHLICIQYQKVDGDEMTLKISVIVIHAL